MGMGGCAACDHWRWCDAGDADARSSGRECGHGEECGRDDGRWRRCAGCGRWGTGGEEAEGGEVAWRAVVSRAGLDHYASCGSYISSRPIRLLKHLFLFFLFCEQNPITIQVQIPSDKPDLGLDGSLVTIPDLSLDLLVSTLRDRIMKSTNIGVGYSHIRLAHEGKMMSNQASIASYNLEEDDTVVLSVREPKKKK